MGDSDISTKGLGSWTSNRRKPIDLTHADLFGSTGLMVFSRSVIDIDNPT